MSINIMFVIKTTIGIAISEADMMFSKKTKALKTLHCLNETWSICHKDIPLNANVA